MNIKGWNGNNLAHLSELTAGGASCDRPSNGCKVFVPLLWLVGSPDDDPGGDPDDDPGGDPDDDPGAIASYCLSIASISSPTLPEVIVGWLQL